MNFTSLLAIEGAESKENMLVDISLQLFLRCMYESVRIRCRSQKHKAVLQDLVPPVSCPWSPPLWVFQIVILSTGKAAIEKKRSVFVHVSYYRGEAQDWGEPFKASGLQYVYTRTILLSSNCLHKD
jgi:hypothetical protein